MSTIVDPKSVEELHDDSPMPIGQYKGIALIDVPAYHLIHLYDSNSVMPLNLREYIKENLAALKLETHRTYTNNKKVFPHARKKSS